MLLSCVCQLTINGDDDDDDDGPKNASLLKPLRIAVATLITGKYHFRSTSNQQFRSIKDTNQSINQSINQTINQMVSQPVIKLVNCSAIIIIIISV